MTIQNYIELARTPLRDDALWILNAGFEAIRTPEVLKRMLRVKDGVLSIRGIRYRLDEYEHIYFVGIGKCAAEAGEAVEQILDGYLSGGYVLDVRGAVVSRLRSLVGTHPLPSERNVAATRSIIELLRSATERDLIITVVSGGGSALLCLPHDIQCQTFARVTERLMKKGATIAELNIVRKHLSEILGGRFAELAYPARIVSLIFSDVPGNDLSTIASGPTVLDVSTVEDARRILQKYGIDLCEPPECVLLETPKDKRIFENVDNILALTNVTALEAMEREASSRGYAVTVNKTCLEGEASRVGVTLATATYRSASCHLYGGETTVNVRDEAGKGGRNQEVALAALPHMPENMVLIAAASDGNDNSQVAGALVDKLVYTVAKEKGLDPGEYLRKHNSYVFFERCGGHIITGKTGSNVSDLFIVLKK